MASATMSASSLTYMLHMGVGFTKKSFPSSKQSPQVEGTGRTVGTDLKTVELLVSTYKPYNLLTHSHLCIWRGLPPPPPTMYIHV